MPQNPGYGRVYNNEASALLEFLKMGQRPPINLTKRGEAGANLIFRFVRCLAVNHILPPRKNGKGKERMRMKVTDGAEPMELESALSHGGSEVRRLPCSLASQRLAMAILDCWL